MGDTKTIAFFPEACYGPALNSVGIAQACEQRGHKPVFLTDPGMSGVYEKYGFEEHAVNMSEPMPPEEMAKYWTGFINGHIQNFNKTPYDQIDNYVKECWANIVNTSVWAQKELPDLLQSIQPDLICVDNVILFPDLSPAAYEIYEGSYPDPVVRLFYVAMTRARSNLIVCSPNSESHVGVARGLPRFRREPLKADDCEVPF